MSINSSFSQSDLVRVLLQIASTDSSSSSQSQSVFPGFGSYTGASSASSSSSADSPWMGLALGLLSMLAKGSEVSASGVSSTPVIATTPTVETASAVSKATVIAAAKPAAAVTEAKTVDKVEAIKPKVDTVRLSTSLKGTLPEGFDLDNPASTVLYGVGNAQRTYKLSSKKIVDGRAVVHYVYESGGTVNAKSRNIYAHIPLNGATASVSSGYSGSSTSDQIYNYILTSPLVFDLDGDGKTSTSKTTRQFDIDNDGQLDTISEVGSKDGLLVMDADGDGKVGENATEVFGNHTANGKFANGFEALKAIAQKELGEAAVADGKLDASEIKALESKVKLSMQVNGQEKSLSKLGITNIDLDYNAQHIGVDENGNTQGESSAFTQKGKDKTIVDVWFKKQ